MNPHTRAYCLLVASQTACLALGLWLDSRFVGSLAIAAREEVANVAPTSEESPGPFVTQRPGRPAAMTHGDSSTVAMKFLVLFWIAALQAVVAYLVLSRDRTEESRKQMVAANQSLQRQNDLIRTRDAVIFGLAKLAESRDPETGDHLERIAFYATRLASALRRHPRYRRQVTPSFVRLIGISSALHDIGKVGVRDSVLLKPGKLEAKERELMQLHAEIGGRCVKDIELRLGSSNFLQMAREIAFSHHERWDGTGYPRGLAGEEIPLAARIVAICDVYDALANRRVYKDRYPHADCVRVIREGAGSQFDPALVEVFLDMEEEFRSISERCADPPLDREGLAEAAAQEAAPDDRFPTFPTIQVDPLAGTSPAVGL